ncbi:IclR family transcriptional regulator [Streptomyces sp. NPDC002577]
MSKALQLLAAFRQARPTLGVTELARRADIPKSTAFRLLADLENAGFVQRSGTQYRLGLPLFELGSRVGFCRPNGLRDVAMPHLSELRVETRLTAHLAVLEGSEIVFVDKVQGASPLHALTIPGARHPASCCGLGKAMLAFTSPAAVRGIIEDGLPRRTPHSITEPGRFLRELQQIRAAGIAQDHEESALGLACISAPVVIHGRVVAAVSLSGPTGEVGGRRLAVRVRQAAGRISEQYAAALEGVPAHERAS